MIIFVYLAKYEITKSVKGVVAFLSTIVSAVLFLYGFEITPIFEGMGGSLPAVCAGGIFTIPLFYWFFTIFIFPNFCCCIGRFKREREERQEMHRLRRERKKPSLFNEMVKEAEERAKPPIKKITVVAKMYLSYYRVRVATLEDFQVELHKLTGLEPHRQLVKLKGKEIHHTEKRLDDGYGVNEYDEIEVFNKGGYLTTYKTPEGHTHHNLEKGILKPKSKEDESTIDDSTVMTESTRGTSVRKSSKNESNKSKKSADISAKSTKKEKTSISGLTTAAPTTMPKGIPDDSSIITMQTKV